MTQLPGTYPERLTKAGAYMAASLESLGQPVATPYAFYSLIREMYRSKEGNALYLRRDEPDESDYVRLRQNLKKAGIVNHDKDYGGRLLRVLSNSDGAAEEIACLADPVCYMSHLSAMQRWGLTDRRSDALILTRPNRHTAKTKLQEIMTKERMCDAPRNCQLKNITHPSTVRRRKVRVYETKAFGAIVGARGSFAKLSTIGQTFLDMVQKSELCGGMAHVIDVWERHAKTYTEEIISEIDNAENDIAKIRAGYILEEYLGWGDRRIDNWKKLVQRGGSRKLDSEKEFGPTFSETWMISLNA